MFGYVTPLKPELKIKEYDLYKSVYCGLCKETGRNFGPFYRMYLNYDFVFLAMLLSVGNNHSVAVKPGRCMVHPLKKFNMCVKNTELTTCSYLSILLLYQKADDNVRDHHGIKRILYKLMRLMIKPAYRKAKNVYPDIAKAVQLSIDRLSAIEMRKGDSLDEPADTFAMLLFDLMNLSVAQEKGKRISAELARHVGRWIYLIDAFDDMEKDLKEQNYNPLFNRFSLQQNETINEFRKRISNEVEFTLTQSLAGAACALELLDDHVFTAVLKNIIYAGLVSRQQKIIHGEDVPENGSV